MPAVRTAALVIRPPQQHGDDASTHADDRLHDHFHAFRPLWSGDVLQHPRHDAGTDVIERFECCVAIFGRTAEVVDQRVEIAAFAGGRRGQSRDLAAGPGCAKVGGTAPGRTYRGGPAAHRPSDWTGGISADIAWRAAGDRVGRREWPRRTIRPGSSARSTAAILRREGPAKPVCLVRRALAGAFSSAGAASLSADGPLWRRRPACSGGAHTFFAAGCADTIASGKQGQNQDRGPLTGAIRCWTPRLRPDTPAGVDLAPPHGDGNNRGTADPRLPYPKMRVTIETTHFTHFHTEQPGGRSPVKPRMALTSPLFG